MDLASPFLRRPVATLLLIVAVVLAGWLGARSVPVAPLPSIDYPVIQVSSFLPGASAETMAASVTTPLEATLSIIPAVTSLTSVSSAGTSAIVLRFALDRDTDDAAQDVQAAIDAARTSLPDTLTQPPVYRKVNPAAPPIVTLALSSATLPPGELSRYARTVIVPRLSQIHGVGLVSALGEGGRAVRIAVHPAAIEALGVTPEQVREQIARATSNGPVGSIEGRDQSFTIAADDQMRRASDFADLAIRSGSGTPVRLRDIATLSDGAENATVAAWSDGRPAVILEVRQQVGANTMSTVAAIRERVPAIAAALPGTANLRVLSDLSLMIGAAIRHTIAALILSIVLVTAILWAFLRQPRAVAIPAIVLPLSLLGTLAAMACIGLSLNMLTLMALTVAAGFIVDDAIVMVENVTRHLERGLPPARAATIGARQITFTIVSLTISVISVFIPLIWMDGTIGRLLSEFGLTLCLAMAISGLLTLTLTPAMCGWLLRADGLGPAQPAAAPAGYARWLERSLAHPRIVVAVTMLLAVAAAVLFATMPRGFLPEQASDRIDATTQMAGSTAFAEVAAHHRDLAHRLALDPAVAGVDVAIGNDVPGRALTTGRLSARLTQDAVSGEGAATAMARLRAIAREQPGVHAVMRPAQFLQLDQAGGVAGNAYLLRGPDQAIVEQAAQRLSSALAAQPALTDVAWSGGERGTGVMIEVDRDRAARAGVTRRDISETLYTAFGQRQISDIHANDGRYPVVLGLAVDGPAGLAALNDVQVASDDGRRVPLNAVATWRPVPVQTSIVRQGRFPAAEISFVPRGTLGEAADAVGRVAAAAQLPPQLSTGFIGEAAELQQSQAGQRTLVLGALVVMYLVLGILYESFIHPLTILSTLPAAAAGGLTALALSGLPLDLLGLTGILLLLAIVKKNAILMIDFAREETRRSGAGAREAIVRAALVRFRPITMTTAAALVGALPLVLDDGAGAELRRPIGIAVLGGLLVAQALTLFSTPVIYVLLARLFPSRARARPPV